MENKQDRPPESINPDSPEPMPDDWKGKTEHSKDEAVVKPDQSGETPREGDGGRRGEDEEERRA